MMMSDGSVGVLRTCTILYATQSGNAEDVAMTLWKDLRRSYGLPVDLPKSIDEYNPISLSLEVHPVVFVVSTTGDGEVPEPMRPFWRTLLRKNIAPDALQTLQFTIIGLGDSNYVAFNAAARKLQKRLLALGATQSIASVMLDESDPILSQSLLDTFLLRLVGNSSPRLNSSAATFKMYRHHLLEDDDEAEDNNNDKTSCRAAVDFRWLKQSARMVREGTAVEAQVIANTRLTDPSMEDRDVRLVRLGIEGLDIAYKPGDVAYILPRNRPTAVDSFLELFGLDGEQIIDVTGEGKPLNVVTPCSIREIAYGHFDLMATPTRSVLHQLATYASDERQRDRLIFFSSAEGADDLYQYATREKRTMLMLFRDFPSVRPPLDVLLEVIPRLRVRAFSIASSPSAHRGEIQLCVALVKYTTPLRRLRQGVCSAFLEQVSPGDIVPIRIGCGTINFPKATKTTTTAKDPVIMIGPGTGVAPFRSYLWELSTKPVEERGETWLFFGCRHERHGDYLFEKEWKELTQSGVLTHLVVAFSRDQDRKVYVQHRLEEFQDDFCDKLERYKIFVAGSSGAMPRGQEHIPKDDIFTGKE